MGAGQAELEPRAGRVANPFPSEGGFVAHAFLRPGVVEARGFEIGLAERALGTATLGVLPRGVDQGPVALLVVAERLRQAGGFALVLAPTRPAVRQLATLFQRALSDEPAGRVHGVTASSAKAARAQAFAKGWVVVTTPEAAAAELGSGRVTLERCALLVVNDAHRAVGALAYAEVARALRRDRPRALVLGLTSLPAHDRRRQQAVADALGLRRVETTSAADADVQRSVGPLDIEVVEVDLPEPMARLQQALESELTPRAAALVRLGALPPTPVRLLTRRALLEAGEQVRRLLERNRTTFFEALRTHAQAVLLAEALEILETQGTGPLASFMETWGVGPTSPQAERALSVLPAVRNALKQAQAQAKSPHPKAKALLDEIVALVRASPGARSVVFVSTGSSAAALQALLAVPPPLGPGISSAVSLGSEMVQGGATVVIAAVGRPETVKVERADLVVYYDVAAAPPRASPARGRRPRTLALVTRDTRDVEVWAASRSSDLLRLFKKGKAAAWAPSGPNRTLPLEGTATPPLPPGGRRR